MRRLHIALAVRQLGESIEDYTHRLSVPAVVVVPHKYAMSRTESLNFAITEQPEHSGNLRHLGFDDDDASGMSTDTDTNGIVWELFSQAVQDQAIVVVYGTPSIEEPS
jgi:hypothetical protein